VKIPGKAAVPFTAAALLILILVVPPFQNPDEPHHFGAAVLQARGEAAGTEVESGIIRMMDRAHWWGLVGIGRPNPLPSRIAEIPFLMEGSKAGDFRTRIDRFVLWHRAAGMAMRLFPGASLETLYYLGRAASALFLAAALFLFWKTLGVLAEIFGPAVKRGIYLILFLPQLILTGTAVSPDAFVLLLSGLFFFGAASLFVKSGRLWPALFVVLPAVIAPLTDRSAFFLTAMAGLLPFFMLTRKNRSSAAFWMVLGAAGAILLAYAAVLAFPLETERVVVSVKYVLNGMKKALPGMFRFDSYAGYYWAFLTDSFLFAFGWLVFKGPRILYWVWRVALGGMAVGMVLQMASWVKDRTWGKVMKWVVFSVIALALQTVGVWVYYGYNHSYGQGRYFHPLIIPLVVFAVLGLTRLGEAIKRGAGRTIVAGAILAEFLLLVMSVWLYIIPAFHLILRGPRPGV
jgi:hypothetical protein